MFLDFANFYKQFIKTFSKIAASLISVLKTTTPSVSVWLARIKANKNQLGTDGSSDIGGGKINDWMANLLSSIKKICSKAGFFTLKASLAFIHSLKLVNSIQ